MVDRDGCKGLLITNSLENAVGKGQMGNRQKIFNSFLVCSTASVVRF